MQVNETAQDRTKILIVDTDTMSAELLQLRFESEGFQCKVIADGHKAHEEPLADYSLILVDLSGKDYGSLAFTTDVKRNPDAFNVPVIILSKKSTEDDIVNALDAGADDFISKPFSTRELIARVRAVVRRRRMMNSRRSSNVVKFQDLVLDLGAGTASFASEKLALTRTEYLILALFLRNRNNFFERAEIRHEAWDDEKGVSDRAVDTNISRLRKKLGDYGRHIINRQGFGNGFVD